MQKALIWSMLCAVGILVYGCGSVSSLGTDSETDLQTAGLVTLSQLGEEIDAEVDLGLDDVEDAESDLASDTHALSATRKKTTFAFDAVVAIATQNLVMVMPQSDRLYQEPPFVRLIVRRYEVVASGNASDYVVDKSTVTVVEESSAFNTVIMDENASPSANYVYHVKYIKQNKKTKHVIRGWSNVVSLYGVDDIVISSPNMPVSPTPSMNPSSNPSTQPVKNGKPVKK
jgi:hypothetical protein